MAPFVHIYMYILYTYIHTYINIMYIYLSCVYTYTHVDRQPPIHASKLFLFNETLSTVLSLRFAATVEIQNHHIPNTPVTKGRRYPNMGISRLSKIGIFIMVLGRYLIITNLDPSGFQNFNSPSFLRTKRSGGHCIPTLHTCC